MAWAHISNSLKKELYIKRIDNGILKQPSCRSDFLKLNEIIDKVGIGPYDDVESIRQDLDSSCEDFRIGGRWANANFKSPSTFYRLENLESFIRKHRNVFTSKFDVRTAYNINPLIFKPEEIFNIIVDAYKGKQDWLNLSDLTTSYFNYRGFSWWTNDFVHTEELMPKFFDGSDLSFQNKWILDFAFKVGISSDWLSESLFFLKFDVMEQIFSVPSIIDAFNQPIFSPQAENPIPECGLAFELLQSPKPKIREYVVRNIPFESVKFIPVRINLKEIDAINPHARLNDKLILELLSNM